MLSNRKKTHPPILPIQCPRSIMNATHSVNNKGSEIGIIFHTT